jgi:hypothetical protein
MTTRMFPALNTALFGTLTINGRTYSGNPGSVVDVPLDSDAAFLGANGWTRVGQVGATAARPAKPSPGQLFVDTAVGATIHFDGATWRHPATGASV